MQQPDRRWTVSCGACAIVVGTFADGRFVHDADCTHPLAIGRGTMRCCRCAGPLTVTEETAESDAVAEPDEPLSIRHLATAQAALRTREARQRG